MNPILAAIEQRRREIGLSVNQLAQRAGFDQQALTALPYARRPNFYIIEAAAGAVDMRLALEPIVPEPLSFVRWRGRR